MAHVTYVCLHKLYLLEEHKYVHEESIKYNIKTHEYVCKEYVKCDFLTDCRKIQNVCLSAHNFFSVIFFFLCLLLFGCI